jgi:hypothetical protein
MAIILPKETSEEQEESIPTVQIEVDEADFQLALLLWDYKPFELVKSVKDGLHTRDFILDILIKRYRLFLFLKGTVTFDCPYRLGKTTIAIKDIQEAIPLHESAIKELQSIQPPEPVPDTQAFESESSHDKTILAYLKAEGQISPLPAENGKYDINSSTEQFVNWFIYNNFDRNEKYSWLPKFIDKNLNHLCTIETLKRYVRDKKKDVHRLYENEKAIETLKNLNEFRKIRH